MLILRSKDKDTPIEDTGKIMAVSRMVDGFVHHPHQHTLTNLNGSLHVVGGTSCTKKATLGLMA